MSGFSFGSSPLSFSNPASSSTSSSLTGLSFGFSSPTTTASTLYFSSPGGSSFGSSAAQSTPAMASPSFGGFSSSSAPAFSSFGSSAAQSTPATASPSFGGLSSSFTPAFAQSTPVTASPSFGGLSSSSTPAFSSFGSSAAQSTPATPTGSFTNFSLTSKAASSGTASTTPSFSLSTKPTTPAASTSAQSISSTPEFGMIKKNVSQDVINLRERIKRLRAKDKNRKTQPSSLSSDLTKKKETTLSLNVVESSKKIDTEITKSLVSVPSNAILPIEINLGQREGYRNLLKTMKEQFVGLEFDFSQINPNIDGHQTNIDGHQTMEEALIHLAFLSYSNRINHEDMLEKELARVKKEYEDALKEAQRKYEDADIAHNAEIEEIKKAHSIELEEANKAHYTELDGARREIEELNEKYEDAKYEGGLWAKDETLKLHPEAVDFFKWMESDEDEQIMEDIGD